MIVVTFTISCDGDDCTEEIGELYEPMGIGDRCPEPTVPSGWSTVDGLLYCPSHMPIFDRAECEGLQKENAALRERCSTLEAVVESLSAENDLR